MEAVIGIMPSNALKVALRTLIARGDIIAISLVETSQRLERVASELSRLNDPSLVG